MQHQLTTYLKLCTEFYDLDKRHSADSDEFLFYMDYAQQATGSILEPMCGTGRFLIPMLQEGLDIEGFDASPYMLQALRQKYAGISSYPAPVWQQFVQNFTGKKQYQLIFVPFGSWGLITDHADAQRGLENMYRYLAPGGTLLLEIETVASVPQPTGIWRYGAHDRPDGSRVVVRALAHYDAATQIFNSLCRYESVVGGVVVEVQEEDFNQYLYRFDEMDELLHHVGFSHIKKYQDFTKTPATDTSAPLLIYECVK